ncbi:MAG: hypothetical protein ACOZHQ_17845 [Thermodesulfobacteriota bacterium]
MRSLTLILVIAATLGLASTALAAETAVTQPDSPAAGPAWAADLAATPTWLTTQAPDQAADTLLHRLAQPDPSEGIYLDGPSQARAVAARMLINLVASKLD